MMFRYIILGITLILNSIAQVSANSDSAVVLMYHRFDENKYPSTNIRKEQFIEQLDYLQNNNFKIWPLHQIIDYIKSEKVLPANVVAITIDDAYASVYKVAFPILKARHIPFTLFVASDPVDSEFGNYMSWADLREMAASGVELGNHSRGHLHLVEKIGDESHEQWIKRSKQEIVFAAQRITEETGFTPRFFAYPYGEFNLPLSILLKDMGYVAFGQQSGAIGKTNDLGYLPRFPISEEFADMQQFATKVSSLSLPIDEVWPDEAVVKSAMPLMRIKLAEAFSNKNSLHCYVSGQGEGVVSWRNEKEFVVKANAPLMQRRSRYNCTLQKTGTNQFYWYSHLWIRTEFPEL
ncbi:MAG: polysaccharide deacetylase family protein [Gammaproteobacteria bacterium]|nr:polysaccharide deacetylase family protein [Gammaproteobacteria bacterium]